MKARDALRHNDASCSEWIIVILVGIILALQFRTTLIKRVNERNTLGVN